jgi:hypothetical protein
MKNDHMKKTRALTLERSRMHTLSGDKQSASSPVRVKDAFFRHDGIYRPMCHHIF